MNPSEANFYVKQKEVGENRESRRWKEHNCDQCKQKDNCPTVKDYNRKVCLKRRVKK